eukprot:COSAG01_NODE_740_length_13891_cov_35.573013_8_plen_704_part_00
MTIVINLKEKEAPSYEGLISSLDELGYTRVPMVLDVGEFSVKGEVIDIFASNQSHPIRIEYDFDDVLRLVSFDLSTQLTRSNLKHCKLTRYKAQVETSPFKDLKNANSLLNSYKLDDYVVHEDHGVGQYKGLVRLDTQGIAGEFIELHYRDASKIYIAIDQIEKIHAYGTHKENPRLSQLYKGQWVKTKAKVQKQVNLLLEDIYKIYQARKVAKGQKYKEDSLWQLDFEQKFKHQLTRDQEKTVKEIKSDMELGKVMDRLICADVGYGKTEVMLRAAFKTVENHQQVLILVPTTLLAKQHYQTCLERFEGFPYFIAHLSRFVSAKDQRVVKEKIKNQQVDIIVGTQSALNKNIIYKNLGLLVIDEEQRFGVWHKEKIKKLKENINVLSISATPIPRTLYKSLTGAKDISKIETAPKNKKAIKTCLAAYDSALVKEAIFSEIKDNGQVFYLYNKVATIHAKKRELLKLCPNLKIEIAHGQLEAKVLNEIMNRFSAGDIDLLLCTTIIENGIDIERANTIIIEGVEKFGLAQLHQLRGRVGRGIRQGHCYLLYDDSISLNDDAKKRLRAIKAYHVLGAGYELAMKDLEIRGAGAMFGEQQHGHIYDVGFALYCKMIESGLSRLETNKTKVHHQRLMLPKTPFILPETYIKDDQERLAFYKALHSIYNIRDLDNLKNEIKDRFGKLPKRVNAYFLVLEAILIEQKK